MNPPLRGGAGNVSPFEALVRARTSVRRYDERAIPDEVILSLLEAARLAPSADNAQPWRFIVVKDPGAKDRLARASFSGIFARSRFAARAPLLIALCAERTNPIEIGKTIKDRAMYQLDCGIAGEHLVLRAAELGLGTCWIGWFSKRGARKSLGVPVHVQVVCLISVGYPAEGVRQRARHRKPLASIAWFDHWKGSFPGAGSQEEPGK
ncbi:MAG: nitroreductase family protein [Spirochaetia bacterium]|jgi:nitroreductase